MNENQKLMLVGGVALFLIVLLFSVGAPIVAKFPPIQRAVVNELKQDKGYCPSPYGPGFDPDAVNVVEFEGWNPEQ